ncbi:MAG: SAM-dependent methyltransferase, partial [Spirochaetota bacterium]
MRQLTGTLYLIPSTLGDTDPRGDISRRAAEAASRLREFIVENDKTARAFLKRADDSIPLRDCIFHILDKHTAPKDIPGFLDTAASGGEIGLLSEAGCPCIADPGADAVKAAHSRGIRVVPLSGPSSIMLSLMSSGFNGQSFTFHGYLPVDKAERRRAILSLEKDSLEHRRTQIFIETPYRNNQMIEDITAVC